MGKICIYWDVEEKSLHVTSCDHRGLVRISEQGAPKTFKVVLCEPVEQDFTHLVESCPSLLPKGKVASLFHYWLKPFFIFWISSLRVVRFILCQKVTFKASPPIFWVKYILGKKPASLFTIFSSSYHHLFLSRHFDLICMCGWWNNS